MRRILAPCRRPRRNRRSILRDSRGSISVEYVLWTSLFGFVFTVIADLTSVFVANTAMWHVGHDAARRLSVAEMTVEEAERYVRDALAPRFGDSVAVTARAGDPVSIDITAPFAEVVVFGMTPGLTTGDLNARLVMRDEIAAVEQIRQAAEDEAAEADLALGDSPLVGAGG
jgi:Flp pilus assembly protein TadG